MRAIPSRACCGERSADEVDGKVDEIKTWKR
jgi:hypothetical protein